MPEETKNAAVSGEWKLVPVTQLKKWHRDMDACQKVMWLRGGFDPAYCLDAQDCLKEMEGVLANALPPYGPAPKVHRYSVVKMLSEDGNKIDYKPHGPSVVMGDVHDAHVTRLQAENAALQQRLNVADQQIDDLQKDNEQRDAQKLELGMLKLDLKILEQDSQMLRIANEELNIVLSNNQILRSELDKAWNLLSDGAYLGPSEWNKRVIEWLANQSSPSTKV